MAGECPGRRSPPAGSKPVGKLSLLVGLAESFSCSTSSSSAAAAEGSSRSPTPRSPRNFHYDGVVGLGIVAAMNGGGQEAHPWGVPVTRTPRPAPPMRSGPIPIVSAAAGVPRRNEWREEEQEMEPSESYTCVISLVGAAAVRKRVYFEDGTATCRGSCSAVLFGTPPPPARPSLLPASAEDFLSRCFRCRKKLHGLDIFMYRGDKAFCSAECRCQQMTSDEHREKCAVPGALKAEALRLLLRLPLFDSSVLRGWCCSSLISFDQVEGATREEEG